MWFSYGSKCMSDALLFIAWLIIPLINLIIGASLLPLNKSSVAFILPAKSLRSNSSESSSERLVLLLVEEKELVSISLNFSVLHCLNSKSEFNYL